MTFSFGYHFTLLFSGWTIHTEAGKPTLPLNPPTNLPPPLHPSRAVCGCCGCVFSWCVPGGDQGVEGVVVLRDPEVLKAGPVSFRIQAAGFCVSVKYPLPLRASFSFPTPSLNTIPLLHTFRTIPPHLPSTPSLHHPPSTPSHLPPSLPSHQR